MTIAATIHAVSAYENGRRYTAMYAHLKLKCHQLRAVLRGETVAGMTLADLGDAREVADIYRKLIRQLWRTRKFED